VTATLITQTARRLIVLSAAGAAAVTVSPVIAVHADGRWRALMLGAWVFPVVTASVEDAFTARLRDRVVRPGTAISAVAVLALAIGERDVGVMIGACAAAAGLGGWLLITHLVSPRGMGYGDVKFAVLLGLGVGVVAPFGAIVVAVAAVVVQGVVVATRPLPAQRKGLVGRRAAPFGPSLAMAAVGFVVVVTLLRGGVS